MSVFHDDGQVVMHHGDVREVLAAMPANSVHMVCCSPPYWGLRDYGTATWDGGDAACDHAPERQPRSARPLGLLHGGTANIDAAEAIYRDVCGKCGARRIDQQLGLEATPEAFVAAMVDVFREVRRVLRADGTCWVNIGDSYAGSGKGPEGNLNSGSEFRHLDGTTKPYRSATIKAKDLVGIPWMLAFALRADGWYLRQDIIWAKPNPMPESVTDRCTKAHEYLFLLSKSPRYYMDMDAIREPLAREWGSNNGGSMATGYDEKARIGGHERRVEYPLPNPLGANKRSVWTIATAPYAEAHFATFPQALVRPCILAGTSEKGCCADCGAPWARVTEINDPLGRLGKAYNDHTEDITKGLRGVPPGDGAPTRTTTGWAPTCAHEAPVVPATVLDPFLGSGTTAMVAKSLGRHAIGVDLSAEYLAMAAKRCAQMGLM